MRLLSNIRVLDLTNVLAGPFATLHLALCGAEVIKIENPMGGDLARKLGCIPELNEKLVGTSFLAQNANKKSITLNLKNEDAKEVFRRLVKTADVVVENFRPGVMERLGFSYEELNRINSAIIYCAISGFGQTGPDAKKPAYDQICQGLSGVMSVNGDETLNPLRCGFPLCDTVAGLNAAFAIMGALFHRERLYVARRINKGQFIDISLLDSSMPLMGWVAANLLIGDKEPQLLGNDNFTAAPSGTFATQDGYINIAANKHAQWEAVVDILGVPELKEDSRFKERDMRKANRNELTLLLEEQLKKNTTTHWVDEFNKGGVPAGAILTLRDALSAPQIQHRGTLGEIYKEGVGDLKLFNLTAQFSETPGEITSPPPDLSQHTEEVLDDLGYTEEEIERLRDEGAI